LQRKRKCIKINGMAVISASLRLQPWAISVSFFRKLILIGHFRRIYGNYQIWHSDYVGVSTNVWMTPSHHCCFMYLIKPNSDITILFCIISKARRNKKTPWNIFPQQVTLQWNNCVCKFYTQPIRIFSERVPK